MADELEALDLDDLKVGDDAELGKSKRRGHETEDKDIEAAMQAEYEAAIQAEYEAAQIAEYHSAQRADDVREWREMMERGRVGLE